mgnify:CR=1 FL=1
MVKKPVDRMVRDGKKGRWLEEERGRGGGGGGVSFHDMGASHM